MTASPDSARPPVKPEVIAGDRSHRGLGQRIVAIAGCLTALVGGWLVALPEAEADLATDGSGRFVPEINWITWGSIPADLGLSGGPTSHTVTNNIALGDKTLAVTCTLSNVSRSRGTDTPLLRTYRPGSWRGDGLDNLYNTGGTNDKNTLVNAVRTPGASTVAFRFACSSTLGGQPFTLPGLVMADAEQEDSAEYVQATMPAGTWRLIDRFRESGCTHDQAAQLSADGRKLRLGPNPNTCSEGPMSVAFMDGATSADVEMYGTGITAIGLGVMIAPADHGDAPASYGDGANLQSTTFAGGALPSGTTTGVFTASLATINPAVPRLGAALDGESPYTPAAPEAPAVSDDTARTPNDEDGVTVPANIQVEPGGSYTLPGVSCTGPGQAAAWFDWNNDGDFADTGERSATAACPAGTSTVSLTWPTVPAEVRPARPANPTYLRLRVGPDEASVANPATTVFSGETEDNMISRFDVATITLEKTVAGRVNGADQFQVRALDGETVLASASTSGGATAAASPSVAVPANRTYIIDDTIVAGPSSAGAYTRALACVDTSNNNAPVSASGAGPTWTLSPLTPAQTVICRITNTPIQPALALAKSVASISDADGNGLDAGDTINYSFLVTNKGTGIISDLAVSDPLAGDVACPPQSLDPNASLICTGSATVTQAQVDQGKIDNTATASGKTPVGPVTSPPSSVSTPTATMATLDLDKAVSGIEDPDGNGLDAGDRIRYSFLVTNTGVLTLSSIAVDDPKTTPVTCPATTLAPGGTTTCTAAYTVTQPDVDSGAVVNTAKVAATKPGGGPVTSPPDSTSTPTSAVAALTVDKSVASTADTNRSGGLDGGDAITYRFTVTNLGAVTLTSIAVSDPKAGAVACPVTTLAPAASTECSATYRVTQADVDAGAVVNTATGTGTPPTGPPVKSPPESITTPTDSRAVLTIDKSVAEVADSNGNGEVDAGDVVDYRFKVANEGTVTLSLVGVTDPKTGTVTCPQTTLVPGASTTCGASAAITQSDVDAGSATNTATASGNSPAGQRVTSPPDDTSTLTTTRATLTIDKSVTGATDPDSNGLEAGDQISYAFGVTNTGLVTVLGISVTDPKAGPVSCPATLLAPGDSITCSVTYLVTQADVDAGKVANTATASGVTPGQKPVLSPPDSTTTPAATTAALGLEKLVDGFDDRNGDDALDAGDVVRYRFEVRNTGVVTLTSLAVTDDRVDTVRCPATTLAPGDEVTCEATYTVTQADVDSGEITNVASATATSPSGGAVASPPDEATTPTSTTAALVIDKSAGKILDARGNGLDAGDTIDYSFVITNTGDVTLGGVAVKDPKIGAAVCDVTTLQPSAAATCTATYTVTQADVDTGAVDNTATATATRPGGALVESFPDKTSTPTASQPALSIDKTVASTGDVNDNKRLDSGDTLRFQFRVENTGTVTLSVIGVHDPTVGPVACPENSLAPAASTLCAADYTVTQADVDAGGVRNSAAAIGQPPTGPPITSPPDSITTPTSDAASLAIVKSVANQTDPDGNGLEAGDLLTYHFVVNNTGAVTLTDVAVADPKVGAVSCPGGVLAPARSMTCTATYEITQADVDAGNVANSATAAASPPDGAPPVTSPPSTTSTATVRRATLSLVKSVTDITDVNGDGRTGAGDRIDYSLVVTNTGVVTLTGITIDDRLSPVACPATSLAPGRSMTCGASHTITVSDVSAGEVINTAVARARAAQDEAVADAASSIRTPTDSDIVAVLSGDLTAPTVGVLTLPITQPGITGTLPRTGSATWFWLRLAVMLTVVGVGVTLGTRRRTAER